MFVSLLIRKVGEFGECGKANERILCLDNGCIKEELSAGLIRGNGANRISLEDGVTSFEKSKLMATRRLKCRLELNILI